MKSAFYRFWQTIRAKTSLLKKNVTQPKRDAILRRVIEGKRIVIIGSGPSAKDIPSHIPDDIVIFACNQSPRALLHTSKRTVDVYICTKQAVTDGAYREELEEALSPFSISLFLTRDPSFVRNLRLTRKPTHILFDRSSGKDGYLLSKLFGSEKASALLSQSSRRATSSGIGLLQHALYYKAQKVYLAGIDMDTRGYAFQKGSTQEYQKNHGDIDHSVAQLVAERWNNVFCVSPNSPLVELFPHRMLE